VSLTGETRPLELHAGRPDHRRLFRRVARETRLRHRVGGEVRVYGREGVFQVDTGEHSALRVETGDDVPGILVQRGGVRELLVVVLDRLREDLDDVEFRPGFRPVVGYVLFAHAGIYPDRVLFRTAAFEFEDLSRGVRYLRRIRVSEFVYGDLFYHFVVSPARGPPRPVPLRRFRSPSRSRGRPRSPQSLRVRPCLS